jgi:cyclophilin family peptidyl-prolyl cis-trans isomerase
MAKRRRRSRDADGGVGEKVKSDKRRTDDEETKAGRTRAERRKQYQKRQDFILLGSMVIVVILIIASFFAYTTYFVEDDKTKPMDIYTPPSNNTNTNGGSSTSIYDFDTPQPQDPSNTIVIMEVENYGSMVIELFDQRAPITTANFRNYVEDGYYNGLIFHRIVNTESMKVVQGGGYLPGMNSKPPTYDPIKLEIEPTLLHVDGAIAMARTNDPDSATSQFYISVEDGLNTHLDGSYAVFGQVIAGKDIYRSMVNVPLNGEQPLTDIIIKQAYIYQG